MVTDGGGERGSLLAVLYPNRYSFGEVAGLGRIVSSGDPGLRSAG